jgi:lipopolysaccharide/colanic/teichoic acid biosynthesis glycosyltransferase
MPLTKIMSVSILKRLFDFLVSFFSLLVLTPLFIVLGCLIRLNDNGPVFFRHRRVGKNGKVFILYKFRSMRVSESSEEGKFEAGDTSRITTIGKFIRKTKLDELPQLFNVFKGDMSLVGPRPEVEKWIAVYPEKWKKILTVRPGITDIASVVYRDEERLLSASADPETTYLNQVLPCKLDLCLDYVDNLTFTADIRIIYFTIKTLL